MAVKKAKKAKKAKRDWDTQLCAGCGNEHVPFSVGLPGQSVDEDGRPICWGCYVDSGRSQLAERDHEFAARLQEEGLPGPDELIGELQATELGWFAAERGLDGFRFNLQPVAKSRPRWKFRNPKAGASLEMALHFIQLESVECAKAFWEAYWDMRGEADGAGA